MSGTQTLTDVEAVVEATRHLHWFRTGLAEMFERLADQAVVSMPDVGQRALEPLLRILGPERATDYASRLYVAAANARGGAWDPDHDPDVAQLKLERLCADAAHAVADEFHRDSCLCRAVTP